MFIAIEHTSWPAPGEVRDLRLSLNAPVLLGPGTSVEPTRAALGWLPAGSGSVVRLWLRADRAPQSVRCFALPESLLGPADRAMALERAERFLAGLGFLFPEAPDSTRTPEFSFSDPLRGLSSPSSMTGSSFETGSGSTSASSSKGLHRDPAAEVEYPGPVAPVLTTRVEVAGAVRSDVGLTKFRRRGSQPETPAGGAPAPTGGIET